MPILSGRWLFRIKQALLTPGLHRLLPDTLTEAFARVVWLSYFSKWLTETSCHVTCSDRYALYQSVLGRLGEATCLDYLEFGVHQGESIKWWVDALRNPAARIYGFDVFTGLPEDWGGKPTGTFDCQGRPPELRDPRVQFEIGLFRDTLPTFLSTYRSSGSRRRIVHLDADLYSSTLLVLTSLADLLHPGDVLIFDEFGSVRNPTHEFRAFRDFCAAYQPSFVVLGATPLYEQVALQVR